MNPPRPPAARRSGVIALLGLRGAGKTSVGARLADKLNRNFVDLDEQIERSAGRSVATLLAEEGEPRFRERESVAMGEVLLSGVGVIATGGGIILRGENRARLAANCLCVWLRATPDELFARVLADPLTAARRPPLTELPARDELERQALQREPLYAALADYTVDTTGAAVVDVVREIAEWVERLTGEDARGA